MRGRNKFRRSTVKPKEEWLFATAEQKETSCKGDVGRDASALCTELHDTLYIRVNADAEFMVE
jgi:hypothetical protein